MISNYLEEALDPRRAKEIVTTIVKLLTPKKDSFDAIAFRGSSGLLIGPAVAMAMDKGMILVRKERPHQGHHSRYQVEGDDHADKYIVIDDQVCSGNTLERTKEQVSEFSGALYIGSVMYYRGVYIRDWNEGGAQD